MADLGEELALGYAGGLRRVPGASQLLLRPLPLYSVSQRSCHGLPFDIPLHEIVLSTALHSFDRQVLVLETRQDNDGHTGAWA